MTRSLDAGWAAEAAVELGQDFVPLLSLEFESGTRYYSTRSLSHGGNDYEPLILNITPVRADFLPFDVGRPVGQRCTVTIDNRKRFNGPATRFSQLLTSTEPEGVKATLVLARASDLTASEFVLPGRVMSAPPVSANEIVLEIGDDISYKTQEQSIEEISSGQYPYARNNVYLESFTSRLVTEYGKVIPVVYGTEIEEYYAGLWTKQRFDTLRVITGPAASVLDVYRPEIWDEGGGVGWLWYASLTFTSGAIDEFPQEMFTYTGVDKINRQLTGVLRGRRGTVGGLWDPSLDDVFCIPNFDNDIDPANIEMSTSVSEVIFARLVSNVTDPIINSGSTGSLVFGDNGRFIDSDGKLRLYNPYGLRHSAADTRLDQYFYQDPTERSEEDLADANDSTGVQFGDGSGLGSGDWSLVDFDASLHTTAELTADEAEEFRRVWDDRIEGQFRTSRSKTAFERADRWWGFGRRAPLETIIGIRWKVVSRGNRSWDRLTFGFHVSDERMAADLGTGRTIANELSDDEHVYGYVNLDLNLPPGVVQEAFIRVDNPTNAQFWCGTGPDAGDPSKGFGAWTRFEWFMGIDYTGAGTDAVVELIDFIHVGNRSSWPAHVVGNSNIDLQGEDVASASITGVSDENHASGVADGYYTWTPGAVINNPADVKHHFLVEIAGVDPADIDVGSFVATRAEFGPNELFRGVARDVQDLGGTIAEMDFASRTWTYCSQGKFYLKRRATLEEAQAGAFVRTITKSDMRDPFTPQVSSVDPIARPGRVVRQLRPKPEKNFVIREKVTGLVGHTRTPSGDYPFRSVNRTGINDIFTIAAAHKPPGALSYTANYINDKIAEAVRLRGERPGAAFVQNQGGTLPGRVNRVAANRWGNRRTDVMPSIPWLEDLGTAAAVVAAENAWREGPRMSLILELYLEHFDLDVGDLITIFWPDVDDPFSYLMPAFDGLKKWLVLPVPAIETPISGLGRVAVPLLQVDL